MKKIQELSREINQLTLEIEEKYPELYKYLEETPLTIPKGTEKLEPKLFSDYLDSLKELLKHHIESHKAK